MKNKQSLRFVLKTSVLFFALRLCIVSGHLVSGCLEDVSYIAFL